MLGNEVLKSLDLLEIYFKDKVCDCEDVVVQTSTSSGLLL